ncbi:MAG: hypothetical protein ACXWCV_05450 [Caldimonas sp.]
MRHALLLACLLSLAAVNAEASQSSGSGAGKITLQAQQPSMWRMLFPWWN